MLVVLGTFADDNDGGINHFLTLFSRRLPRNDRRRWRRWETEGNRFDCQAKLACISSPFSVGFMCTMRRAQTVLVALAALRATVNLMNFDWVVCCDLLDGGNYVLLNFHELDVYRS